LPERSWREAGADDLVWARNYFLPWVLRRIHPQPDALLQAKRPQAAPVFGAGMPQGTFIETVGKA
jgi:hypothetical protein